MIVSGLDQHAAADMPELEFLPGFLLRQTKNAEIFLCVQDLESGRVLIWLNKEFLKYLNDSVTSVLINDFFESDDTAKS